jgi:hypothetical protein
MDPVNEFGGVPGRALLAWLEGQHAVALERYTEYVESARTRHDMQGTCIGLREFAQLKLQLGLFADAEAAAREAFALSRESWRGFLAFAVGPLVETLVRLGAEDVARTLSELEQLVDQFGFGVARPQLLRARGLLLAQQHAYSDAIQALQASADVARSQHALVDLARTLAVLASVARDHGEVAIARQADAERVAIVERIGPETRGLTWRRACPSLWLTATTLPRPMDR